MRDKVQVPTAMVAMRHSTDVTDEYSEVTKESFDEYYSQNGWVLVSNEEVLEINGASPVEATPLDPDQPSDDGGDEAIVTDPPVDPPVDPPTARAGRRSAEGSSQ